MSLCDMREKTAARRVFPMQQAAMHGVLFSPDEFELNAGFGSFLVLVVRNFEFADNSI
jgi:hypothetical protein